MNAKPYTREEIEAFRGGDGAIEEMGLPGLQGQRDRWIATMDARDEALREAVDDMHWILLASRLPEEKNESLAAAHAAVCRTVAEIEAVLAAIRASGSAAVVTARHGIDRHDLGVNNIGCVKCAEFPE